MTTEEQLKQQNEVMKKAIIAKYSGMTIEEIADDVVLLTDKAIEQGFNAGLEIMRNKVQENIKNWEREQILKVLMS